MTCDLMVVVSSAKNAHKATSLVEILSFELAADPDPSAVDTP